jgi:DNA-binding XRE family transcriptional regulator
MSNDREAGQTGETDTDDDGELVSFNEIAAAALADLDDEDRAAVEDVRAKGRKDDERYAMSLGALRQALNITQETVAGRLGVRQTRISETEHQSDMLVSTLASVLDAIGLQLRLVVTVEGRGEVEIDLPALANSTK